MSGPCGIPGEKGGELPVDIDALARSLTASIGEAISKSGISKRRSIPMVPKLLQLGIESEAYKPKILSLGPYHHCNPCVQGMKQVKLLYLDRFLDRNRNISLHKYLAQVNERESEARMAYAENCNMSSNDFVEMLLLDCCFVIEIICSWNDAIDYDNFNNTYDNFTYTYNPFVRTRYSFYFLIQDMLLLENQLPFFLIRHLFNSVSSQTNGSLEELITNFFESLFCGILKVPSITSDTSNGNYSPNDFLHILHLLHCSISPKNIDEDDSRKRTCCCLNNAVADSQPLNWIPCAVELKNAGIDFVRKDVKERHVWWKLWNCKRSSREIPEFSFLDITFEEGRMIIPEMMVYDHTETILRNLIAFEQCYVDARPYVTAYAIMMDNIITTEADVELLQKSEVLVENLGDSKEVAVLFNKLAKNVVEPSECYSKVYADIQRHCSTDCNKWRAKLNHDYFSNPWAIISLIAACLLFILTITQTILSVLSYVRPKGS